MPKVFSFLHESAPHYISLAKARYAKPRTMDSIRRAVGLPTEEEPSIMGALNRFREENP